MFQNENNQNEYSTLSEKFGTEQPEEQAVPESPVVESTVPEYLVRDTDVVPESLQRPEQVTYSSLGEKFGGTDQSDLDLAALSEVGPEKPTLGELTNRFVITTAEAFNMPFKAAGQLLWQYSSDPATMVARYLHERKYGEGTMPEALKDQSQYLKPAETTQERVLDVAAETLGATLSMFIPTNASAQIYARTAGLSRVAGQTSAFERGVPLNTFLDRKAAQAYTARTTRQKARAAADEGRRRSEVALRNVGRRLEDLPGQAVEAAQAIAQSPRAIARSYIDEPVANATFEIIGATGAGIGAGLMEAILPGSIGGRFAGEVVGGFFLPPGALLLRAGTDPAKRLVSMFSKQERHKIKLAQLLTTAARKYFKEMGMDYSDEAVNVWKNKMLAALANRTDDDFNLTPGQITGDEIILGFEANVAKKHPQYKAKRERNLQEAYDYLDNILAGFLRTGDPEDLRLAVAARYAKDKATFDEAIQEAQRELSEIIAKTFDFTDAGKAEASLVAKEIIEGIYDLGIGAQQRAWGLVGGKENLFSDPEMLDDVASNTLRAVNAIRGQVTLTRGMPFSEDFSRLRRAQKYQKEYQELASAGDEDGIADLVAATPKNVRNYRVKDLINLRRDLLDTARDLKAKKDINRARMHNELANAILMDLDGLAEMQGNYAYLRAIALSKAFNDAFADNFISRVVATDERGNPILDPQSILDEAFGSGGRRARERFSAMRELGEFRPEENIREVAGEVETFGFSYENLGPAILNAEEAYLRANLSKLRNANGEITANSLNNFLKNPDNRRILSTMTNLRDDLSNLNTAIARVKEAENSSALKLENLDNSAFSNLVGDIHPSKAVAGILVQSKGAVNEKIKELADEARESGDAALRGLRRALLDFANKRAGAVIDSSNEINTRRMPYSQLKAALVEPIDTGMPSIEQLIKRNRIMTEQEWNNYMAMVDEGVSLEERIASPAALEALSGTISPYSDLAIRLIGAKIGAGLASASPGGAFEGQGLVAAGAGVRLSQNIFAKTPLAKLEEVQVLAASDTEFLKEVLMAQYTPTNRQALTRQINLFLIHAGMLPLEEGTDENALEQPAEFRQPQL